MVKRENKYNKFDLDGAIRDVDLTAEETLGIWIKIQMV